MNLKSAVTLGNKSAVTRLLQEGESVNESDFGGRTPLSHAASTDYAEIVKLLLAIDNINVNYQDENGRTPLSYAAAAGKGNIAKLLLRADGIDINLPDSKGQTPLRFAISEGNTEIAKHLLAADGIDCTIKDNRGITLLSDAAYSGNIEIVKLLLRSDAINSDALGYVHQALRHAAMQGNVEVLKLLLATDGIDINYQSPVRNITALWLAASCGKTEAVKLLLMVDGIDVNLRDDSGHSPLDAVVATEGLSLDHGHIFDNRFQIVELLLGKDGIEVDLRVVMRLAAARDNGYAKTIQLLVGELAKSDIPPDQTPIAWAVEKDYDLVLESLLYLKPSVAEVRSQDSDGYTLLSKAARNDQRAVVGLLARYDRTILHLLVQQGNAALTKYVLSTGHDISIKDGAGRTALHVATIYGFLEIARVLIVAGGNVNTQDVDGITPLDCAIRLGLQELIKVLLENSVQVKGITSDQWLDAHNRTPRTVVSLSEWAGGKKSLCFIEPSSDPLPWLQARPGQEKCLFVCPDYATWARSITPTQAEMANLDKSRVSYCREEISESHAIIYVTVLLPAVQEGLTYLNFDALNWQVFGVAWTLTAPPEQIDGPQWKTRACLSMLPYGWIPEDGIEFLQQFIDTVKQRWLKLCDIAEEHLSKRRIDQLREMGKSSEFVLHLAQDARQWAELRSNLRGQVKSSSDIARQYCRRHGKDKDLEALRKTIDSFSDDVDSRISQLDQTIRDLLQLEFAWVSINEAHRSTIIATSMKRLSWITFIFLPALYASSLFGMNVNILKDNPDWRWYILFGGVSQILVLGGWLVFKYTSLERWIERNVGSRISRCGASRS